MASRKSRRSYPVEWDDSTWEQSVWRPQATFQPTLDLVEQVARNHGRLQYIDELLASPQDVSVSFRKDCHGQLSINKVRAVERRAVVQTHAIQRAVRVLEHENAARIIRQVDRSDECDAKRRKVIVEWKRQPLSTADQIHALHRAVQVGSVFKIEKAWFGLTPRAHEYLKVGYDAAQRRGDFAGYVGKLEVSATIIPVRTLAPDLLKIILPYAVRAVTGRGRRPVHARDEVLAKVLTIFIDISGRKTSSARRGGYNEPMGSGADFVRRIEAIFGVQLMPKGSTHGVARARKRMTAQRA